MMAGAHLVQGILAGLVRRGITGAGGKVEVCAARIHTRSAVRSSHHISQRRRQAPAAQRRQQRPRLPRRSLRNLQNGRRLHRAGHGTHHSPRRAARLSAAATATPIPKSLFDQRDEIKIDPGRASEAPDNRTLAQHPRTGRRLVRRRLSTGTASFSTKRSTRSTWYRPSAAARPDRCEPRAAPSASMAICSPVRAEHHASANITTRSPQNLTRYGGLNREPHQNLSHRSPQVRTVRVSAMPSQWASFEAEAHTGLTLEAVAMDLHPLEDALLTADGMSERRMGRMLHPHRLDRGDASGKAAPSISRRCSPQTRPGLPHRVGRLAAPAATHRRRNPRHPIPRRPRMPHLPQGFLQRHRTTAAYQAQFNKPLAPPETWRDFPPDRTLPQRATARTLRNSLRRVSRRTQLRLRFPAATLDTQRRAVRSNRQYPLSNSRKQPKH